MREDEIGHHTYAFGAYLVAMSVGLLVRGPFTLLALFAGLLGAMIWLTRRRLANPSQPRWVQECLFYPLALNTVFPAMAGAVPAIRELRYDEVLLHLDQAVFSLSPNVWAEQFVSPALTELMSLCYLFFMPLLFFSLARYLFWRKELLGDFYRGLFTLYGIGFLGYLLVPAAGPYLAFPDLFSVPLTGGLITQLTQTMVVLGSNKVDVFPSLHCAISAYILGFACRHHRRQFYWMLLPVAGLWCSTIYLRYHYLVDVICGFALALLCLMLTRKTPERSTK